MNQKEVNAMQIRKTITVVAASLAVTGAAFGTVAAASSSDGPKADTGTAVVVADTGQAEAAESSAADTDKVQEGDQTAPEQAEAKESGAESESAESDGPGGHEDPPGNVDHQFEGEE
jgi:hypothetical protein